MQLNIYVHERGTYRHTHIVLPNKFNLDVYKMKSFSVWTATKSRLEGVCKLVQSCHTDHSLASSQQTQATRLIKRMKLHGGHVIEGMVQFFTNGLVLQFLGIQLICGHAGGRTRERGEGGRTRERWGEDAKIKNKKPQREMVEKRQGKNKG